MPADASHLQNLDSIGRKLMTSLEIFFLMRILLLAALNEDEVGERLRHQGVKEQQAPAAYVKKSEQADAQPFKRGTLYTLKGESEDGFKEKKLLHVKGKRRPHRHRGGKEK